MTGRAPTVALVATQPSCIASSLLSMFSRTGGRTGRSVHVWGSSMKVGQLASVLAHCRLETWWVRDPTEETWSDDLFTGWSYRGAALEQSLINLCHELKRMRYPASQRLVPEDIERLSIEWMPNRGDHIGVLTVWLCNGSYILASVKAMRTLEWSIGMVSEWDLRPFLDNDAPEGWTPT